MENVCRIILENDRSLETDPYCAPVSRIFEVVGFEDVKRKDKESEKALENKIRVIIPAAGKHPDLIEVTKEMPCCMLDINGKSILERQKESLAKIGLKNIIVIRGYQKDKVNIKGVNYFDNPNYTTTSILASLMQADSEFGHGFIYLNSDILFDEKIIKEILENKSDIVIVVDNSYKYHKHGVDKNLDLVITKYHNNSLRQIGKRGNIVLRIGKKINKELAHTEFVGIAKFSKEGAANLKRIYEDCLKNHKGKFHEAESFQKAGITDMLQEMIDRGFKISVLEIHQGWMEIHNKKDLEEARKEVR